MTTTSKVADKSFESIGSEKDSIDVQISHRIIQLFSEGLYSSPNKAVEELVSNAFDADAENVHVILSPDLQSQDATIVVIDDGEGMDVVGFKNHWIIGRSIRRHQSKISGRKPIGKFGIGKLATYVLGKKLTHICKKKEKYYAATMDYEKIDTNAKNTGEDQLGGVFSKESIALPLRELTEEQAALALDEWVNHDKPGYRALKLFGSDANESWTVAIMSDLTSMGKEVKRGRLNWILRTAMPLRDDFNLYLNGQKVEPSKIDAPLIEKWVIGKDILPEDLPRPAPDDLVQTEDVSAPEESTERYGLSHDKLGRIYGYIELFKEEITGGKSAQIERSNGFFVYVRGRMINTEDPGFGIERNLLRHGTFSKFRAVIHIDNLDEALRSSRESLQEGHLYSYAQNILHSIFNLARKRLVKYEKETSPGVLIGSRISSVPGSLTRKPLLALAKLAVEGKVLPLYTQIPKGLTKEEKISFLEELVERASSEEGLFTVAELEELDSKNGFAIYDIFSGKLKINLSHPFVAAFQDSFRKIDTSLPLEMFAISEVIIEANLHQMGLDEDVVRDILSRRDELLRQLVRSSAKRNAGMVALALTEARDDADQLEEEVRASFEIMGFDNVIRIGGKNQPDGTAEAHLSATTGRRVQRYKVGLEAKSGGKASANRLNIAGIGRHMKKHNCDHHIIVGTGFYTSGGEETATVQEIEEHKEKNKTTITLIMIDDLARLVRLVPLKRIGLDRLRELFINCITPEESKLWIDNIEKEKAKNWPYKEILETIWTLARSRPDEPVEYAAVFTALEFRDPPIHITKTELKDCCRAIQTMAGDMLFARANTVELNRRPDLVLNDIKISVENYPEAERNMLRI